MITCDPRALLKEAQKRASKLERDLAKLRDQRQAATIADLAGDADAAPKIATLNAEIAEAETPLQSLRLAETGFQEQIAAAEAARSAQETNERAQARRAELERVAAAREAALSRADASVSELGRLIMEARLLGEELNALHQHRPQLMETLYAPARLMGLLQLHLGAAGLVADVRADKSVPLPSLADSARAAHNYHLDPPAEAA